MNVMDIKNRIAIGNATIYLILFVSLAGSMAYWYVLSGVENTEHLSTGWTMLLWVIIGVGIAAEIVKKVTLSTFRNKRIWLLATLVSVLTVMGTYSILDSTRQSELTKQSDAYQSAKNLNASANKQLLQYAWAANFSIEQLEAEKRQLLESPALNAKGNPTGYTIEYVISRGWRSYTHYKNQIAAIDKKITAKYAYDSAQHTSQSAANNMNGSGSVGNMSSTPMLNDLASIFTVKEALIKMLFFLLVTVLLEVSAYWIGGRVEKLSDQLTYSKAELLDRKNKAMFGITMAELGIRKVDSQTPDHYPSIANSDDYKEVTQQSKVTSNMTNTVDSSRGIGFTSDLGHPHNNKDSQNIKNDTIPSAATHSGYQHHYAFYPPTFDMAALGSPFQQDFSSPIKSASPPTPPIQNKRADTAVNRVGTLEKADVKTDDTEAVYEVIRKAVVSGEVKPTYRPLNNVLKENKVGGDTNVKRRASTEKVLTRLAKEGVLIDNPKWSSSKSGIPKYLVARQ